MASARNRSHRVSYEQLDRLWEFLNSHRDLAVGFYKSAQARDYSKRMWLSISKTLNSLGECATKDWKGWSNYWVDYKAKLKRRVAALRTSQNRTGGGPADVNPLSDVEKKFLSLLGEGFGSGLPNTQVDPFPILTPPTTHVGPDDGQPQPQNDQESFSYDGPQTVNIEQPPLSQQGAPSIQEEESSAQQAPAQSQRLANIQSRRRSRRPSSMSQQLAREALVERVLLLFWSLREHWTEKTRDER
ncbi:hypothetical protein HF086_016416 [Spodoptera exigua]|uniref:Regulatory protein zeste n=1 Tax=Spodoptera exigua TaxID=7107 RepID=A0A922MXI8_SPOEX|nr:hypothetical protein HF086_016416 [Spodoptera exigua]